MFQLVAALAGALALLVVIGILNSVSYATWILQPKLLRHVVISGDTEGLFVLSRG